MAIHIDDLKAQSVPAEVITGSRHPPESVQQKPRESMETAALLTRKRGLAEQGLEVIQRQAPVDQPGSVLAVRDRGLLVLLA